MSEYNMELLEMSSYNTYVTVPNVFMQNIIRKVISFYKTNLIAEIVRLG